MSENNESCGNCRYVVSIMHDFYCHRFPRKPWPPMLKDEWCGEWKEKEVVGDKSHRVA